MGTLVCTIELDKTTGNGIKVTIDNADEKITQTIQMDGTSVTITVKKDEDKSVYTQTAGNVSITIEKGEDKSTYTQAPTSVSIKCKTFEVTAEETITMKSTKDSTYKSSEALTVQAAKALTLKSTDADLVATAQNIKGTGQTGVNLAVAGNKLDLSAAGVTLKSEAMLTVTADGPATLKGAITNVQGNLVNLG